MHSNDRKRRLPVEHRGQRVPNLYKRPKREGDRREGDTFEIIFRDDSGKQRQKTLNARTIQRAVAEAEEYRTRIRRGELTPPSRQTFGEVAAEFLGITEALVATGERSQRTADLYGQRYRKHIAPILDRKRIQDVRPSTSRASSQHSGARGWLRGQSPGHRRSSPRSLASRCHAATSARTHWTESHESRSLARSANA
jgi:hypothetical protein